MDANINNILEPKESIVWQGVINRKVLNTILIFSLIVTFAVGGYLYTIETIDYTSNGEPAQISGSTVGMGIIAFGLLISLYSYFSSKVKEYAVTKKRVIIKSGLIGTDFKSVYFDQIKNVIVDVGIIGKIFNVGSVKIDIGKTETYSTGGGGRKGNQSSRVRTRTMYDILMHIDNPYEVYKHLQQSLSGRKESLYSGRADRESNPGAYNSK